VRKIVFKFRIKPLDRTIKILKIVILALCTRAGCTQVATRISGTPLVCPVPSTIIVTPIISSTIQQIVTIRIIAFYVGKIEQSRENPLVS
jgi:hypothetical protein